MPTKKSKEKKNISTRAQLTAHSSQSINKILRKKFVKKFLIQKEYEKPSKKKQEIFEFWMYWCVRVLELPKKYYFVDSYFAEKRIVAVWVIFQYSKLFIRRLIRLIKSTRNKVNENVLRSFIQYLDNEIQNKIYIILRL